MKTCNLKIKDIDPFMKANLIINSSAKSTLSNKTVQSVTKLVDNSDEDVNFNKNIPKHKKKGNLKAKQLEKTKFGKVEKTHGKKWRHF